MITESQPNLAECDSLQILKHINPPNFFSHEPDAKALNKYLEPAEVGHLNYLTKCYTDALLHVKVPKSAFVNEVLSPLDFIDIHICGAFQVYFIV